ncbi:hypothetical protein C8R44DRAFT_747077 [Mycena epipterygia]|nr:hypothetical protein C8R44DRAFT_747077 [Mycena epipterygia]
MHRLHPEHVVVAVVGGCDDREEDEDEGEVLVAAATAECREPGRGREEESVCRREQSKVHRRRTTSGQIIIHGRLEESGTGVQLFVVVGIRSWVAIQVGHGAAFINSDLNLDFMGGGTDNQSFVVRYEIRERPSSENQAIKGRTKPAPFSAPDILSLQGAHQPAHAAPRGRGAWPWRLEAAWVGVQRERRERSRGNGRSEEARGKGGGGRARQMGGRWKKRRRRGTTEEGGEHTMKKDATQTEHAMGGAVRSNTREITRAEEGRTKEGSRETVTHRQWINEWGWDAQLWR